MEVSNQKKNYDVIIIGGSYAGLASALTLGRSLRNVLIIDSGNPCNKQTPHSQNFLTRDGMPPGKIAEIARSEVAKYPTIEFYNGFAVNGSKKSESFSILTSDGKSFEGKKLIFATGLLDTMNEIPGFAECWGISVIHCPYCHGYEFRNKKTAILASGDRLVYFSSLIKNLTNDVTLITSGNISGNIDTIAKLKKNGINVIDKKITEIEHHQGHLRQVRFSDGTTESFEAMYAPVPFQQHCKIPNDLGCDISDSGLITVDSLQKQMLTESMQSVIIPIL